MAQHIHSKPTILRRKQVEARTGLARSTIYHRISEGTFPRPVNLSTQAVGWVESEVDQWIVETIKSGRQAATTK